MVEPIANKGILKRFNYEKKETDPVSKKQERTFT